MSRSYDIFLSHSGAQKEFVEHLNMELGRVCGHYSVFFDRDAIQHGDQISTTILEYAKTCKLAVAVLSEEYFTRSKPPMMELVASYTSAKDGTGVPCLFPVFLVLKPEDAKDKNVQLEWQRTWQKWEVNEKMSERRKNRTSRVQPTVWKEAVDRLLDTRGPVYKPHENEYDPEIFLKKVAQLIAHKVDVLSRSLQQDEEMDRSKATGMEDLGKDFNTMMVSANTSLIEELVDEKEVQEVGRMKASGLFKTLVMSFNTMMVSANALLIEEMADENKVEEVGRMKPLGLFKRLAKNFNTMMMYANTPLIEEVADEKEVIPEPQRGYRVVVCLDFGTTSSTFAFAHVADPDRIYTNYEYRGSGREQPSCITMTAIYYYPRVHGGQLFQVKAWGTSARFEYYQDKSQARRSNEHTVGTYVTRFNPHLTSGDVHISSACQTTRRTLRAMPVERPITDYLHQMGLYILEVLQSMYGPQLTMQMIQWSVPVPSFWRNAAKEKMKTCMEAAGLLHGVDGSPHPVKMVCELEAASFHSLRSCSSLECEVGDKLVVVDIGEATYNFVVQEVVSVCKHVYRVKEVTSSLFTRYSSLDSRKFFEFLESNIGPCMQELLMNYPLGRSSEVIDQWDHWKICFGSLRKIGENFEIDLPRRLADEWERYDQKMGYPERESYDVLTISYLEIQMLFDPVIGEILGGIYNQYDILEGVRGRVKALVLVGDSLVLGSTYVMSNIKQKLSRLVPEIISPINPLSAAGQGAVALALALDLCNCAGSTS